MDQRANAIARFLDNYFYYYIKHLLLRIKFDIKNNAAILVECIAIEPLMLIYAFETRIMIVVLVFGMYAIITVYAYATMPGKSIANLQVYTNNELNTSSPILKVIPLYVTLMLWFLVSKIWSGPSYSQDCIWLQPQIKWPLFFTVLIQNILLFLPENVFFDYLWLLNYVYPERSMISTCASWIELLLRGIGLSALWMFTPETLRVRSIGLFLVNSWFGLIFFVIAWSYAYLTAAYQKKDEKSTLF